MYYILKPHAYYACGLSNAPEHHDAAGSYYRNIPDDTILY